MLIVRTQRDNGSIEADMATKMTTMAVAVIDVVDLMKFGLVKFYKLCCQILTNAHTDQNMDMSGKCQFYKLRYGRMQTTNIALCFVTHSSQIIFKVMYLQS